jgi:NAD(P)-dependent dehydrogenase (short-subunit alcohol dehydrogenase family)
MNTHQDTIIIIGASSEIAQAFLKEQRLRFPSRSIVTISQSKLVKFDENHNHFATDYDEKSILQTVHELRFVIAKASSITIFNGQLHNEQFSPEKRFEDISASHLIWQMQSNFMTPLLWLKAIAEHLDKNSHCVLTCLSARVGSINDNRLGGWYSYRASKAALNMAVKTLAIELARRAKHCKCVLFHPGTTDTALSKPFHRNVPANKLFTPSFVAAQLSTLITNRDHNSEVDYIDWQGEPIEW